MTHVCDERNSEAEYEEAETDGEEPPVLEEGVGPVVHHPGHQGLHVAELTVDAEHEEHHEEDCSPENRAWQREDLDTYMRHNEDNSA